MPVAAGFGLTTDQFCRDTEALSLKDGVHAFLLGIGRVSDPDYRPIRLTCTGSGDVDFHFRTDILNPGHQILMRCHCVCNFLPVRELLTRRAGGVASTERGSHTE